MDNHLVLAVEPASQDYFPLGLAHDNALKIKGLEVFDRYFDPAFALDKPGVEEAWVVQDVLGYGAQEGARVGLIGNQISGVWLAVKEPDRSTRTLDSPESMAPGADMEATFARIITTGAPPEVYGPLNESSSILISA